MTQDEIIEMLREAAGSDMPDHVHGVLILHTNDIDALIKLVAAKEREVCTAAAMTAAEEAIEFAMKLEREACAKVCEPQEAHDDPLTAWKIAQTIRARGET